MTDFDQILSKSTRGVEDSIIIKMAQRARDLKSKGRDVVSLTIGEPDFDTPQFIKQAATDAMDAGFTHYSPMPGMPQLREALSAKLKAENGLTYSTDEIVITNGAKQAITNAAFALLDPNDEVIMPTPFWVAYEGISVMAGGKPVILKTTSKDGFKMTPAALEAAVTDRTKLLIFSNPCNPSGAVYTRDELEALAAIVRKHPRMMVMSDEIYEYIVFDKPHVSFGTLEGMRERTITINGFSKGFAMTGWRLGFLAAAFPVAKACAKVQGTFTAGANAFVQMAGVIALGESREECRKMTASYHSRRDLISRLLADIPGVSVRPPNGTFYIFPDVSAHLGKTAGNHRVETVEDLCMWLLDEHDVATVPGGAFGDPDCLRMSFACSEEDIEKGIGRMKEALGLLS
ncbi:MAG: pyridoxal phosphate-dependent aminotransferase [Alphaproteobacteria bacterium]|nr:pyridoxal phosphate-dependent aminotransferase [Alphaproteobacteria bacterium]